MPHEYSATIYEEKPISRTRVSVAAWSPTMDIIAIGSPTGIVSLHKYKMGVNWEVTSQDSGAVTHIAWRPDGDVLAVAYESGRVEQLNHSNGSIVYTMEFGCKSIELLSWVSCEHEVAEKEAFFPPFSSLSIFSDEIFSSRNEVNRLSQPWINGDSKPSILVILFADRTIRLFGCGFYELLSFPLDSFHKIYECSMAHDFSSFSFFSLSQEGALQLNRGPSPALAEHCLSLQRISYHVANLLCCKNILIWCLKQLQGFWESTLVELDSKLTTYSRMRLENSPDWSLRNELMEVILFGHVSIELKEYFKRHWSPSAIRRTGIAMFKAYDAMEAVAFQQFQFVLMQLICEASELLGCIRDHHNFECFGLKEEAIIELIQVLGTSLQKTHELHAIVKYCSQYLRPFFHWLYEVADSSIKDMLRRVDVNISQAELALVITFVTERFTPCFINGQLKSYQIELVEQYIRRGGITKPLDLVMGFKASEEYFKRTKLKNLIPLHGSLDKRFFPDGIFATSNSSLADLIEVRLSECINKVATFGEVVSPVGLFQEPEPPLPLIDHVSDISKYHLCSTSHNVKSALTNKSMQSLGGHTCVGVVDRFAFVRPRNDLSARETIFTFSIDPSDARKGFSIDVDGFATDDNPLKKTYNIVDMKFFEISTLAVMLTREDDISSNATLQWILFIPLDECFAAASSLPPNSLLPVSNTLSDYLAGSSVPLSRLVTHRLQVHALPYKPYWFTLNEKRHTIFVMFDSFCRVFIMKRREISDEQQMDDSSP
nr:anaphase promoting complex subunit 4 [Hymenolepis microstoma]